MDDLLLAIGENLDRVCSLEMRYKRPDNGIIHKLYSAARERTGIPLTMAGAELIRRRVSPGDSVIIVTGAGGHAFLPKGETDGPLGAAAVARAITLGLGAVPIILTEGYALEMQTATCVAAGIGVRDLETARRVPGTFVSTARSSAGSWRSSSAAGTSPRALPGSGATPAGTSISWRSPVKEGTSARPAIRSGSSSSAAG